MFTPQHYVRIAAVLRESSKEVPANYMSFLIAKFAHMFKSDNLKFNTGLFWDECQPLDGRSPHAV